MAHTACMLGLALWFSLHLRKHSRLPRFLPPALAVLAVLCLAAPFFMPCAATLGAQSGGALSGKYLLFPALGLCLCLPVGLYLFYKDVPKARQGAATGCALAAGELLWIVVLPLLRLHVYGPGQPEAVLYLYAFLCFSIAGMAGCLALALRWQDAAEPNAFGLNAAESNTFIDAPSRAALLCLILGGAFFSVLIGLALGDMPRGTGSPSFSGSLHFPLLFIAPLIGVVLDGALRNSMSHSPTHPSPANCHILCLCLAAGIAAVPIIVVFTGFGFTEPLPILLLAVRLALMTALFVLTARLAGGSPFFPLLGVLVWCLLFVQHGGIVLAQALAPWPGLRIAAAFALALASILLLRRFTLAAKKLPALWSGDKDSPESAWSAKAQLAAEREAAEREAAKQEADKRLAFSAVFALSAREAEVLACILRDCDREAIAQDLGISDSTVKFHIRNLLQKTRQGNRQRLLHFYTSWKAE